MIQDKPVAWNTIPSIAYPELNAKPCTRCEELERQRSLGYHRTRQLGEVIEWHQKDALELQAKITEQAAEIQRFVDVIEMSIDSCLMDQYIKLDKDHAKQAERIKALEAKLELVADIRAMLEREPISDTGYDAFKTVCDENEKYRVKLAAADAVMEVAKVALVKCVPSGLDTMPSYKEALAAIAAYEKGEGK